MDPNPPQDQSAPAHVRFRLSAQRALLGNVTPAWRSVSLSVDESRRKYRILFVFTLDATDEDIESAQSAAAEIMGDFLDWEAVEDFHRCDPPEPAKVLDWLVYSRNEERISN